MPRQKKKSMKKQEKNTRKKAGSKGRLVLQIMVLCFLMAIAAGLFYFYQVYGKMILKLQAEAKQKVSASSNDTFKEDQTSLVYDVQGNLISTLRTEKDVYYLSYKEIPATVIDAMLVSEDRNFLQHDGVDYLANIRAAIALIKHKGEITQGASTITQQLARNVFLTHKVTYERKLEEIFIAQELEKKYSKSDILEFYFNEIYFANGYYGIQAAAKGYFGEGVSSLSMSQLVFLCSIPNNPNLYNPVTNMNNTLKRRDRILDQMYEAGIINQKDYQLALKEEIELNRTKLEKQNYVETYTYYSAIRALMKKQGFEFRNKFEDEADKEAYNAAYDELYYSCQKDLYSKGYRIYTSIDLEKQQLLQEAVDNALAKFTEVNEEGVYKLQAASVCIDNDTGRVVAIVGGREQDLGGYTLNRAYQSFRQPGSAIKPLIVYTPIFERGYTPDSLVEDVYSKDGPKNADKQYAGEIKLQRAIEASKNVVAWELFVELTPQIGLEYLLRMNFSKISESDYIPAAALGGLTVGASSVEMAAAYAAIENDGFYREPTCIIRIMDSQGEEVVGETVDEKQIYKTEAARIMTEALTGVMKKGTGKGIGLSNTVSAGKTGTTNDQKDGWFVGYTPYYTTSVWVGYDLPKALSDLRGASYPGGIWHNFMEQIHTNSMTKNFLFYDWRPQEEQSETIEEETAEEGITENEDEVEVEIPEEEISNNEEGIETEIPDSDTNPEDSLEEEDNYQEDNSEEGLDTEEIDSEDNSTEGEEIQEEETNPETIDDLENEETSGDTLLEGEGASEGEGLSEEDLIHDQ
ncbi:MAG: transglycosylase domain-containing protein [Mobilitalea sp.]